MLTMLTMLISNAYYTTNTDYTTTDCVVTMLTKLIMLTIVTIPILIILTKEILKVKGLSKKSKSN